MSELDEWKQAALDEARLRRKFLARAERAEEALLVSTTMLEALLVQLNSWGHESAVNARGQIFRNEELLASVSSQKEPS